MKTVLTNGCFDVFHCDHARLLQQCRELGERVIVALNSDASVRRQKGPGRPVNCWAHRREVLLALRFVDEVVPFDTEEDLKRIVQELRPILVKGPPWKAHELTGAAYASEVVILESLHRTSTTEIVQCQSS